MAVIIRTVPFARRFIGSVVSALVVAAIALLATVLFLFFASLVATSPVDILALSGVFAWAAVVTFVVMAVMALVGAYSRWYLWLVSGIVTAFLAGLLGDILWSMVAGGTLTPSAIFDSLAAAFLPIEVFVIIAVATAGRLVYRAIVGGDFGPGERRIAIVRAPAENLADGQVTHIKRKKIDTELADRQWDAYVTAFAQNGWDVLEVPIAEGMADSVFVEDAVALFGELAVVASPGSESRRGETPAVETAVRELGLSVERIELPGTLDGGDVLKVGSTVYVGRGGRTNAEGIRQLRVLLAPLGYSVVAVPTTKALHLKSAVTALPDGTVIGYGPVVDNPGIFDRYLDMPEEGGAHVVVLDVDTVLMAASAPKSAALIADLGYTVVTVDISEFEKLEGCVPCLSGRVR